MLDALYSSGALVKLSFIEDLMGSWANAHILACEGTFAPELQEVNSYPKQVPSIEGVNSGASRRDPKKNPIPVA